MNNLAEEHDKKVKQAITEAHLAAKEQEQLRSIMVSSHHSLSLSPCSL